MKKIVYTNLAPAGVMELVDVVDSKSTDGDIVPVRVRPPAPINPIVNDTFTMGFILCTGRIRTHPNATCRWHVAATSSKTGGYLNFCPSPARAKMQIESGHRVRIPGHRNRTPGTKKQIPIWVSACFLFPISKVLFVNNAKIICQSFGERFIRGKFNFGGLSMFFNF